MLHCDHIIGGEHRADIRQRIAGRRSNDRLFFLLRGIAHPQLEHEAVELCFRQRIRPLLLDRILRREDEERRRQAVRLTGGGDLMLLHRLEQRGLRLGWRAIDLVGEHDVGEHRPAHEPKAALAGGEILLDDLGAGDVGGHQVGRELNPVEGEVERLGNRLDHHRLGESRHADQERVTTREDCRENPVQHVALAHDALPDLREQIAPRGGEALEELDVAGNRGRGTGEGGRV